MDATPRSQGFQRLLALHDWYLRLTPDEAEIVRTEVRDLIAEVERLQVLGDTMAERERDVVSSSYADLPEFIRDLVEPHVWDNMNQREQRDWLIGALNAERAAVLAYSDAANRRVIMDAAMEEGR